MTLAIFARRVEAAERRADSLALHYLMVREAAERKRIRAARSTPPVASSEPEVPASSESKAAERIPVEPPPPPPGPVEQLEARLVAGERDVDVVRELRRLGLAEADLWREVDRLERVIHRKLTWRVGDTCGPWARARAQGWHSGEGGRF